MRRRLSVAEYLASEETNRPQELAYGVLREPPAPSFDHQVIAGRIFRRLSDHVERHALGVVAISPVDVVLDEDRALVVQPDVLYVAAARQSIVTDRVWGAPDLAVEVLSFGNGRHDRTTKVQWYGRHGVRECWLVDAVACTITVADFTAARSDSTYEGPQVVRSAVLPRLRLRPATVFAPR